MKTYKVGLVWQQSRWFMYQDAQLRQPIETGSLLARSYEDELDHSNVPIEGNSHEYWGSENPSN